jgi:SAM-dependent methyltransferase
VERRFVHAFYETAASHFAATRHTPWPRVVAFVEGLARGSLVADVGCGNGRLMVPGQGLVWMGVDASAGLCREAMARAVGGVCVGDATRAPLRSGAFDAVLSIAVMHHLSTLERRRAAMSQVECLLRPGGRAIVQVWALEQPVDSRRVFKASDVMVPWKLRNEGEGEVTLQRFCHLFVRGELEDLARDAAPACAIDEAWYDRGNWCVVLRKME